jgi:hypothetical protein
MVTGTGTNTLGFIMWTLALTAVGWAATVIERWIQLKQEKLESPMMTALRGSSRAGLILAGLVLGIVVIVFSGFFTRAVYFDHEELVERVKALTDKMAPSSRYLIISGFVSGQWDNEAVLHMTVTAVNPGSPSTAHGWKLTVHTSKGDVSTRHALGSQRLKGALALPFIDQMLERPLGTNVETSGSLVFIVPHFSQKNFESLVLNDPTAKLILTAFDNVNNEWPGEVSIQKLVAEKFKRVPAK